MKRFGNLFALLVLFTQCTSSVSPVSPENLASELTIRSGTAFGFCMGYCEKAYVFNGTRVSLTEKAPGQLTTPAPRSCESTISEADWNNLVSKSDLETFGKQPAVIGCPDCADGGAEYIELEVGTQKHRVTFPHGETIPGFETLVSDLRKHRESLKECK
ncbi:hypothetical protein GCM10028807_57150 [Spirosoma daeguense]